MLQIIRPPNKPTCSVPPELFIALRQRSHPTDCVGRHIVGSAQLTNGLPSQLPLPDFLDLVGVSLGFRPSRTPRAFARSRPSVVRALISSRSNSAKPPRTVRIRRPVGVVVSAQRSARDRNEACLSERSFMRFRRSLVLRARRSNLVTTKTSPGLREAISLLSRGRSVFAPLAVSSTTLWQPAALSCWT